MSRHSEAGETLLEVLLAVVISGLAVTGFLAGLAGASRAAASHRDHADVGTYLVVAADLVKAAPYDDSCSAQAYEAGLSTVVPTAWTGRGGSLPKTSVQYWNPLTSSFDGSCPAASETRAFMRMQLVTITVTAPDGAFADSVSVTKRDVT